MLQATAAQPPTWPARRPARRLLIVWLGQQRSLTAAAAATAAAAGACARCSVFEGQTLP